MKGMLQKPDMVTATGEGRKNNTRRLGGLKEINKDPDAWTPHSVTHEVKPARIGDYIFMHQDGHALLIRPLYQVGETVYIKEAWWVDNDGDVYYKSDWETEPRYGKWKSPLFLPERFARYFVKVLDNKPERLQEITEEDARFEGCITDRLPDGNYTSLVDSFANLWNSINPSYPWDLNPWCFRVEYKLESVR